MSGSTFSDTPPGSYFLTTDAMQHRYAGASLKDVLYIPGFGLWYLFRTPLEGSFVRAVKAGAQPLNLGACRIAGIAEQPGSIRAYRRFDDHGDRPELVPPPPPKEGRWPSNLLLLHSPDCYIASYIEEELPVINRFTQGMKPFGNAVGCAFESVHRGKVQIPVWACTCAVKSLGEFAKCFLQVREKQEVLAYLQKLVGVPLRK